MPEQFSKILIVDDEPNMLHMLSTVLREDGFHPQCAEDGPTALEIAVREPFDFILSDVRMPGMDGIQLLEALRDRGIEVMVILMSAYGSIDLALEGMRKGAYDYISKPFKTDEVVLTLRKAAERERLRREVVRLRRRLLRLESGPHIVWAGTAMKSVLHTARHVAPFDSSVLITGESGTGKELLAREIHARSQRAEGPFLAVNCGALAEGLLESELFGHARGAFTGANEDKTGIFEEAEGGTLLLDEIGCMDPPLQAKILRFLDSGEIRRVGENSSRTVSVRILAATNEDLEAAMESGRFRQDLFFRLNVVNIHLPPLRERKEDIIPLVEHFVSLLNRKMGRKISRITKEAQKALLSYGWRGNVRELQNVMERAMILSSGDEISLEALPDDIRKIDIGFVPAHDDASPLSLKKASRELERTLIVKALNRTGGNRSQASALLEISYPSLLQKIRDYGIL